MIHPQALKVVKRNSPRDKIKLLRRNHRQNTVDRPLSSTEHSVRKEIAVMKKCRHANIVRLFEVIDDPQHDKIFLGEPIIASRSVLYSVLLWFALRMCLFYSHGVSVRGSSPMDKWAAPARLIDAADTSYHTGCDPRA